MKELRLPSQIVADEMLKREPQDRPAFLRDMLAHVAAGIVACESTYKAAEACYRVADAVVTRRDDG